MNPSILIVGDVLIDVSVNTRRLSRTEYGCPIHQVEGCSYHLGGAARFAAHLRNALPKSQVVLAAIPPSDGSERSAIEQGMSLRNIFFAPIASPPYQSVKMRIFGMNGEQFHRLDWEIRGKGYDLSLPQFDNPPFIILSDYDKGALSPTVVSQLLTMPRSGLVVAPKPTNQAMGPAMSQADLVVLNEAEKHQMTVSGICVVTRGADSVLCYKGAALLAEVPVDAITVEPCLTVGAGDAFLAGLVASIAQHGLTDPLGRVPHAVRYAREMLDGGCGEVVRCPAIPILPQFR